MKKIFGRKRSSLSNSFSLPSNFSEQVLELEILINQNPSKYSVLKLVKLYSTAVEYYETQKDPKYIYFHGKLQELLIKPDIMPLLDNKPSTPLRYKKSIHKKRLNSMNVMRHSESLIEDHNNFSNCSGQKLVQNLKGQEETLASRIRDRHKRFSDMSHKISKNLIQNCRNSLENQSQTEIETSDFNCHATKEQIHTQDKSEFIEQVKDIEKYKISDDLLRKKIKDSKNRVNYSRRNVCVKVTRGNHETSHNTNA